jgi:integrase
MSNGTDKRGSVASVLFPHTVLSYQNAAGGRYTPPRRASISTFLGHKSPRTTQRFYAVHGTAAKVWTPV